MRRRSFLAWLGMAPVTAPAAVAAVSQAAGQPVASAAVASLVERTTALENMTARLMTLEAALPVKYEAHAFSFSGPVATAPLQVEIGAGGRASLTIDAVPRDRSMLSVRRNGDLLWSVPGNFMIMRLDDETGLVGAPTFFTFSDHPGPGLHSYTLESDTGGDVHLSAVVV